MRSRLFLKYAALFVTVVVLALMANGAFDVWFSYRDQKASLIAHSTPARRGRGWQDRTIHLGDRQPNRLDHATALVGGTLDQRRFDALRLLRQVPAITELAEIDLVGPRAAQSVAARHGRGGQRHRLSKDPAFTEAVAHKVYYGPVYFRRAIRTVHDTALAGTRRDAGVSIAQVNLKLIWDVVSAIKFGEHGLAYVVDGKGRLIAHPDISLVLRNTDMSQLAQVRTRTAAGPAAETVQEANDIAGHAVLTAYAPVAPLGWLVFVETPIEEAYAPLYASIQRTGFVLLGALALAFVAGLFLARRMVVPIKALRAGAARIGAGDLSQRIASRPATRSRRSPTSSTTWPASCRSPMPTWRQRSKSALES